MTRTIFLASLALLGCLVVASPAGARPDAAPAAEESLTIPFGSRTVQLWLDESSRNGDWGDRVIELLIAGGPVLEELIGVPYPGGEDMSISERTTEELSGYAGMAGCSNAGCHIRLVSDFDDETLLHEVTHAWTRSFRNRWLAEGMAEYVSERATARIHGRTLAPAELANDTPPYPLQEWLLGIDFIEGQEEEMRREHEGYYWSLRFFEQLEAMVGQDAIKRALATVVPLQEGQVGVRRFMDALDDAGAPADDLFIRYVFPPEQVPEIQSRRLARDRVNALAARAAVEAPELNQAALTPVREHIAAWEFALAISALDRVEPGYNAYLAIRDRLPAIRVSAEQAGLPYPYAFGDGLNTWAYAPFLETIDQAEPAVQAYASARARVAEPRNFWTRLGLMRKDPESHLDAAVAQFAAGNFAASAEDSRAAEAALAGANSSAVLHTAIGAIAVMLILLVVGLLLLRRPLPDAKPVAAKPPTDQSESSA
jgi:hypothetical protein